MIDIAKFVGSRNFIFAEQAKIEFYAYYLLPTSDIQRNLQHRKLQLPRTESAACQLGRWQ